MSLPSGVKCRVGSDLHLQVQVSGSAPMDARGTLTAEPDLAALGHPGRDADVEGALAGMHLAVGAVLRNLQPELAGGALVGILQVDLDVRGLILTAAFAGRTAASELTPEDATEEIAEVSSLIRAEVELLMDPARGRAEILTRPANCCPVHRRRRAFRGPSGPPGPR